MVVDIPLGREELIHAKIESTYGTFVTPAATDAIRIKKANLNFMQGRKDRDDKLKAQGFNERITQMKRGTWSINSYLIPSGTAGTAPDIGDLLKALFGVETVNASTSVVYTPSTDLAQPYSLSLYQQLGHMGRGFEGCIADKMKIVLDKKNEAEIEISGFAADSFHMGTDTVLSTVASGQSQIATQSGQGDKYSVGAKIKIGSQATEYTVTAVSSDTLTISPVLAAQATIGDAIVPFPIAATTVGTPIGSILGSFTIAGNTVYITKATINYDAGRAPRDDEYGRDEFSGAKLGDRKVTFEFELFLRDGYLRQYGKAKRFVSQALSFVVGTAAGKICTLSMPAAEFTIPQIDAGDVSEVLVTVPGVAMMSSATGNDELTMTFT